MTAPAMPEAYVGCASIAATNARYKELWVAHQAERHVINKQAAWRLQEDHRRAMEYLTALRKGERVTRERTAPGTPPPPPAPRRRRSAPPEPQWADDDRLTITCATCDETKRANKFPTRSGKPGQREGVCRDCKRGTAGDG